jgi:hypothetical protein
MIGASNSIVTMQLIEGSNQMDYLLDLLDFIAEKYLSSNDFLDFIKCLLMG